MVHRAQDVGVASGFASGVASGFASGVAPGVASGFACYICDRTFAKNSGLQTHISSAHTSKGVFSRVVEEAPAAERLEVLRAAILDESISYGEIAELQGLASSIDPSDVLLLEWAGVPEGGSDDASNDPSPEQRPATGQTGASPVSIDPQEIITQASALRTPPPHRCTRHAWLLRAPKGTKS